MLHTDSPGQSGGVSPTNQIVSCPAPRAARQRVNIRWLQHSQGTDHGRSAEKVFQWLAAKASSLTKYAAFTVPTPDARS